MILNLSTLKYYFLTCDTNGVRKHNIMKEFGSFDITEINPVLNIGKNKSGSIGVSRMIDAGLRNQQRDKPFQPFVIIEDDATKYRTFPDSIVVPDDADLLYIGISKCGIKEVGKWSHDLYMKNVDDTVVRIYNMLSSHGIIVCSAAGALAIQKCMCEGYFTDIVWDNYTSYIQRHYNVYALKQPLVYQNGRLGGAEPETRFELTDVCNNSLPENGPAPIVSALMCRVADK